MTAGPNDFDPNEQWQMRPPPPGPQGADQYRPTAPGQYSQPPPDQQAPTWQMPGQYGQQWPGGYGAPYQMHPMVAPRNPALGVLLSLFIPGLGSMVNGRPGKGVLILATYCVGWLLILVLIGLPIVFGTWIWGMVDGYQSAQSWNRSHGIIS
jgi:TM2 domain-containing membrane protein YozV